MYTEENFGYNENFDENYEENNDDNNYNEKGGFPYKNVVIRVLIIFVCLLLVVWLVAKLTGGNKNNNDGTVFNNNVDTIRLASEKYFFIDKNLPENTNDRETITLRQMNNDSLVAIIYDYKNNACSTENNDSYATLTKTNIAYELTIKLTCDEEVKEVTYYYDLKTGKCLSCGGQTYMDGSLVLNDDTTDDENKNDDDDDNDSIFEITCNNWSTWTTEKIVDSSLDVRMRTLIKGYKTTTAGEQISYGNWSEYTETPIVANDTLEVETKVENASSWSDVMTTTSYVTNSDTRKVLSVSTSGGGKSCKTVTENVRGQLTASTYASYNSQGIIVELHRVYNEQRDGKWVLIYDATYKKSTQKCSQSATVTTYSYQDLISSQVTLYRSRTITKTVIPGNTEYTDYVETLPGGYTKVEGSEVVQYSYKDKVCK